MLTAIMTARRLMRTADENTPTHRCRVPVPSTTSAPANGVNLTPRARRLAATRDRAALPPLASRRRARRHAGLAAPAFPGRIDPMQPSALPRSPAAFGGWLLAAALLLLGGCQTAETPAPSPATAARTALPPAPTAGARNAFVVLSGGGTPSSNNYSQYLQARALTAWLRSRYPADSLWVFFGVGNRTGEQPVLADVYRQIKDDSLLLDTWLPGDLPDNRPATKAAFLRALREEILPRVRDGGTLYLIVGDHGELTRDKEPQSAITLWGLVRDAARPNGWTTARDHTLAVPELREALGRGLGRGRVVFAMTQCHSGGFHGLGVAPEMRPPETWFAGEPRWLPTAAPKLALAAGFTATDQESIAAGCDPAPDPDTWFGYERFFPEQLLGRDLLSGEALGPTRFPVSFAAAHRDAVLIDQTVDKPRSTSEHFLERWAALIETHLARELLLEPRVRTAVEAFQQAVDTGRFTSRDAAWQEAHTLHLERLARLAVQNPSVRRTLVGGNRQELEKLIGSPEPPDAAADEDAGPGGLTRAQSRAWRETLRPAWTQAVQARAVTALPPAARPFEERLLQIDTRGRPAGFADTWSSRALTEQFWASTLAVPGRHDPATSGAVARWAAVRRTVILAWADASPDENVRKAAQAFGPEFRRPRVPPAPTRPAPIPADIAAARVLFHRRILAAWEFLLTLEHQPALDQLRTLQQLERTPLPNPR